MHPQQPCHLHGLGLKHSTLVCLTRLEDAHGERIRDCPLPMADMVPVIRRSKPQAYLGTAADHGGTGSEPAGDGCVAVKSGRQESYRQSCQSYYESEEIEVFHIAIHGQVGAETLDMNDGNKGVYALDVVRHDMHEQPPGTELVCRQRAVVVFGNTIFIPVYGWDRTCDGR